MCAIRRTIIMFIIINITAAWAVDREFVHIGFWADFGLPFVPFGVLGVPFDRPLHSRWPPWDTMGHLWGPFGAPWAPGGPCGGPIGWQARFGDLASAEVPQIAAKSAFLELATGEAEVTEVVSKTLAQTPPSTHAGGQDDGSYTNSLKLATVTQTPSKIGPYWAKKNMLGPLDLFRCFWVFLFGLKNVKNRKK